MAGLCTRIDVYRHAGYFPPEAADELKAAAHAHDVRHPPAVLRGLVERFGRDADEAPSEGRTP